MLIRLKELRLKRGYSMLQAARKIFSHLDTYNRYLFEKLLLLAFQNSKACPGRTAPQEKRHPHVYRPTVNCFNGIPG